MHRERNWRESDDASTLDETAREQAAIARAAVRALVAGRAQSIDDAVTSAMHALRSPRGTRRPTRAQLRAHAQALEESHAGPAARQLRIESCIDEVLRTLSVLEQTLLQHGAPLSSSPAVEVYGRAAEGHFDLDSSAHFRVITALAPRVLAQALLDGGLGDAHCGSMASRYGRIDELALDGAFVHLRIARIPSRMMVDRDRDLVRGNPVIHADFATFTRRMAESNPNLI